MTDKNLVSEVSLLLANYADIDEKKFLERIITAAGRDQDYLFPRMSALAVAAETPAHLKYLLFKAMGLLARREFLPVLEKSVRDEQKIRLALQALESLLLIPSPLVLRILERLNQGEQRPEITAAINNQLKQLALSNPVLFYCRRLEQGLVAAIDDPALEFLSKKLDDGGVDELLLFLDNGREETVTAIALLLRKRPRPGAVLPLLAALREHFKSMSREGLRLLLQVLAAHLPSLRFREGALREIQALAEQADGWRRRSLGIMLAVMAEDLAGLNDLFLELDGDEKEFLFNMLTALNDPAVFVPTLSGWTETEENSRSLQFIAAIMSASEGGLEKALKLVSTAAPEKALWLLRGIRSGLRGAYPDQGEISSLLARTMADEQLQLELLETLFLGDAASAFDTCREVFLKTRFPAVRRMMVKNLEKFDPDQVYRLTREALQAVKPRWPMLSELLPAAAARFSNSELSSDQEAELITPLLVMLEKAAVKDLNPFVQFLDRCPVRTEEIRTLVVDELRMVLNTVLESKGPESLVKALHQLIKKLERTRFKP